MSLVAFEGERLSTTVGIEGSDLIIALNGTADLDVRTDLASWLRMVHEEVLRLKINRVVVDIRKLEFMSSLCLNAFVGWLATIMEQSPAQQYRVHFKWSRDMFWQRKSLNALRRFALMLVTTDP
jgi:hypothetical protein